MAITICRGIYANFCIINSTISSKCTAVKDCNSWPSFRRLFRYSSEFLALNNFAIPCFPSFDTDLRNVMPWAKSTWSHTDLSRLRKGRVSAQVRYGYGLEHYLNTVLFIANSNPSCSVCTGNEQILGLKTLSKRPETGICRLRVLSLIQTTNTLLGSTAEQFANIQI